MWGSSCTSVSARHATWLIYSFMLAVVECITRESLCGFVWILHSPDAMISPNYRSNMASHSTSEVLLDVNS